MSITTPITKLFGIKHPILLAGMNQAAGPELAAAVTNAGGLGVIGGVGYTPEFLREQIADLKAALNDKSAPFGVDLLLPQVGAGARKTNYDYTKGSLPQLVDVIIASGCKLFVAAVGVPPKEVVDKLHKAGIPVMNMIGHPKHVSKALAAGVDIICAQGGEGGGHTGDVPTSILIPEVVELCNKAKSPLTGDKVHVIAAGGIYNGKSLAAALAFGAEAVWVGTRFVAAKEAGASKAHQEAVTTAGYTDTLRTIIFTGRPMRVRNSKFIAEWEAKPDEIKRLTGQGVIPAIFDLEKREKDGTLDEETELDARPFLMGAVAAAVNDVKPAAQIVDEMMAEAVQQIKRSAQYARI
ncbi:2-nitropropane dioxygenase [Protomyces lactucae-debilis]|uniref:2-nitropropane dioxygenase n=1 Tax=Protomyces lactucae-debilis TaxID=2754530 RepID=A0A1Y2FK64_PROLT|nr:2-nitropropane dioxygenase [Protomyces lactucae-debilis]ORY83616.1 2-nitropropane dioxygenase [Protomyces lactucae-debilis]